VTIEPAIHNTFGVSVKMRVVKFLAVRQTRRDGVTVSLIEDRARATGSDGFSGETFPSCSMNSNIQQLCYTVYCVYLYIADVPTELISLNRLLVKVLDADNVLA
jgi:hypothetical protein